MAIVTKVEAPIEAPVQEKVEPAIESEPELKETPGNALILKRLNDLSRLFASHDKILKDKLEEPEVKKPLPQTERLEQIEKNIHEKEQRTNQRAIKASVLSAMMGAGLSENSAKKLLPSMLNEGKFEVAEDEEVMVEEEGGGIRKASDFVKALFIRDDWASFLPVKKAPPKLGGRPQRTVDVVATPNEYGVYKGSELRRGAKAT
jgi:hypothetical protein